MQIYYALGLQFMLIFCIYIVHRLSVKLSSNRSIITELLKVDFFSFNMPSRAQKRTKLENNDETNKVRAYN